MNKEINAGLICNTMAQEKSFTSASIGASLLESVDCAAIYNGD